MSSPSTTIADALNPVDLVSPQELCDYDLSVLLHRQLIGNVPAALVKGGTQAAHTELVRCVAWKPGWKYKRGTASQQAS